LPEPFKSLAINAAQSIGCDVAYVAAALLVSIAAAIGTTRRVRCKEGWDEFPILWVSLVGNSGCGKSPALDIGTQAIKRFQRAAALEHQRLLAVTTGSDDERRVPRKMTCVYCEDVTVEALIERLDGNPRGLVVIRDELAAWVESMNTYKGGHGADESIWLSFFDGREAKHDRKTANRTTLFVPRAAVSLVGGIQPRVLKECLTARRVASGMAARLLLIHPPETVQQWTDTEIDSGLTAVVNGVIDRLYQQLKFDEHGQPSTIGMSLPAQALFKRYFNDIRRAQAMASEAEAAVLAKSVGIGARIALCLHLAQVPTIEGHLEGPTVIDTETMQQAIQLSMWFTRETLRVRQTLCEPPEARRERETLELVARLQREGKPTTVRQLMRHSRNWNTAEETEAELVRIAAKGKGHWVNSEAGEQGGRPTRYFKIGGVAPAPGCAPPT
jgi:hypothetical protein